MKVRHILVKHLYEAEDLLRLLHSGKKFEELARKHSLCSSASSGGELGDLLLLKKNKNLDSDFSEALDFLKKGQTSKPIRTKFGYHLIEIFE